MGIYYSCFLILSILTVVVLSSMYITLLRYENRNTHRTTVTVRPNPIAVKTKRDRQIQKLQRIQRKGLSSPSCPHVLIFTHPRSGSTLTGHIIQHVHESFYAFEPLRYLSESLEKRERIVFLNRTERSYQESDTIWMKAEILYRWFTCDFDRVNLKDLSSMFIGAYSTNLNEYAACVRRIHIPTKTVPECIPLLKGQCNRAGVRIIKTIRLNIESVELLLELMPNLKVIYLTRDPRGKLASQMALKPAEWDIVTFVAKDLCELLIKETDFILKLREKYPQRLKI
ncbi:Carbohydrate sulfotransferase 1 [Mizuhopecten yessoensis]|uniref:Carbohydrate sulfotransferase 1 n=1 Tax=Mizuhopecten yessoensis TaxID=6573 RepID=A0A210R420_MIZYE|nr:Carbohydrate sulfotransferase 1 [Mizuhopecten yessoensis]